MVLAIAKSKTITIEVDKKRTASVSTPMHATVRAHREIHLKFSMLPHKLSRRMGSLTCRGQSLLVHKGSNRYRSAWGEEIALVSGEHVVHLQLHLTAAGCMARNAQNKSQPVVKDMARRGSFSPCLDVTCVQHPNTKIGVAIFVTSNTQLVRRCCGGTISLCRMVCASGASVAQQTNN